MKALFKEFTEGWSLASKDSCRDINDKLMLAAIILAIPCSIVTMLLENGRYLR
jgi:hypothetical protein